MTQEFALALDHAVLATVVILAVALFAVLLTNIKLRGDQ
jgi:hypothetical protein